MVPAKKAALLLFSVAVLLAGGVAAVRGQSALDGFDPNANGAIRIVVVQRDGKILIAGDFTALSPNGGAAVTRNYLARLNRDGTLDTAFNPNPSGGILSMALQEDGRILVGGVFGIIGGQTRRGIARLDAAGLADSFDPNPNGDVYSIAVQADGKILAGGVFTSIGGQPRNNLARLDATSGSADAFNPNAQGIVQTLAVQSDGKILVGGSFEGANSIGGQARNHVARLDPSTGLADSFDPNANSAPRCFAVQADGKILAGGQFSGANSIGGATRNYIARLDPVTGLADSFNPNANNTVFSIAVQTDGKILAGGFFTGANSIGGQARNFIARLDPTTGLADVFDPNPSGLVVFSIAVQADGKTVAGGNFTSLSPNGGAAVTRNNIARLETDGRLDRTLDLSMVGSFVWAIAVQPDGKVLIGGNFTSISSVARTNIARLHTDGTLDLAFNPNANGAIESIAVQADGRILVGGEFNGANSIAGATRNYIARLNADGTLDTAFNPNAGSLVLTLAVQADGKVLAGGTSTNIGGLPRNYLARLDASNGLPDAFDPNPDGAILSIAVQMDGKILAGGYFTSISGLPRNYIARLDATNGMADAFNPNASGTVGSMVVYPYVVAGRKLMFSYRPRSRRRRRPRNLAGKPRTRTRTTTRRIEFRRFPASHYVGIMAGGAFTNTGGATRNNIARLDPTTGLAEGFDPDANDMVNSIAVQSAGGVFVGGFFTNIGGQPPNRIARLTSIVYDTATPFDPNASDFVNSLAIQADGKILAGGSFTNIGGQPRNFFARLNNGESLASGRVRQSLEIVNTYIYWYVLASGPLFTRVTFEYSIDNVNYVPLGNPEFSALFSPIWFLEHSGFPTGQNFYLRARGYYSSGLLNGSGSIMEYVQNVFLPTPPLRLNIQFSANTNVVLSWATNYTGFTLETSTNLNTNVWSTVSPAPVVSGTNNVVTNAINGPMRFYRLRR